MTHGIDRIDARQSEAGRTRGSVRIRSRRSGRTTRSGWLGTVVAVAAFAMLASACVVEEPPSTNPALAMRSTLLSGALLLEWAPTISGQANGYKLEQFTDGQGWQLVALTDEPTYLFTDVTPRTRYQFRLIDRSAPGEPSNKWSPLYKPIYVEPALPVMRINTDNNRPVVDKNTYLQASYSLDPNGSSYSAFSGALQIRGRGNSTWAMPKKPYKLKLESKTALMGLTKSKKFELLANYFDKSHLRTDVAAQISNMTDLAWTPSYRHVELILNGQYMGIYQLAEKGGVDSTRVNITEMTENDNSGEELTGGYLMEIDARYASKGNPGFNSARGKVPIAFDEPDPPTAAQKQYIQNFVNNFENVLLNHNFNPETGYPKYLDVEAFIDHWIVQEVTRNQDAFWSSTYFSKDRNSDKLVFGPIWDFDNSMGNPMSVRPLDPDGWDARLRGPWTYPLFRDPVFVNKANARLAELAPRIVAEVPPAITATYQTLLPAVGNDEARWNYTTSAQDTPSFLSTWLGERVTWMTTNLAAEAAEMN